MPVSWEWLSHRLVKLTGGRDENRLTKILLLKENKHVLYIFWNMVRVQYYILLWNGCTNTNRPLFALKHWRSSFAPAAVAFAAATAGSSNPRDLPNMVRKIKDWERDLKILVHCFMLQKASSDSFREAAKRKMSITSSAATMRVLSVLRHWVTKHGQVALSEIMDND